MTAVITTAGMTAAAATWAGGGSIALSEFRAGTGQYDVVDGGGVPLAAALSRTALNNELVTFAVTAVVDFEPGKVAAYGSLPAGAATGIGEIGVYLADGTLFAVVSNASQVLFNRDPAIPVSFYFVMDLDAQSAGPITLEGSAAGLEAIAMAAAIPGMQADIAALKRDGHLIAANVTAQAGDVIRLDARTASRTVTWDVDGLTSGRISVSVERGDAAVNNCPVNIQNGVIEYSDGTSDSQLNITRSHIQITMTLWTAGVVTWSVSHG